MKKAISMLLVMGLSAGLLAGCGAKSVSGSEEATAENPMVLTLSHGLSETHTVHIAMEEFAELQQQISKQIRGYDDRIGLLEEMADAYICLNFPESIFDIKPEDLQKAIDVKLERERRNL